MSLEQPPTLYVQPTTIADIARKVNEWGGSLAHWLRSLQQNSSLDSVLLKDIALANGQTTVNHKLGRQPQEYWVTKQNAAASIYWVSWTSTQVVLSSSAVVTVHLRFA